VVWGGVVWGGVWGGVVCEGACMLSVKGLQNIGSSCYMNSLLQVIVVWGSVGRCLQVECESDAGGGSKGWSVGGLEVSTWNTA